MDDVTKENKVSSFEAEFKVSVAEKTGLSPSQSCEKSALQLKKALAAHTFVWLIFFFWSDVLTFQM